MAWERQNDGGSISMVMMGRWVAAALAKVGRCSSMSTSPRMLSSSLEGEECWVEAGDLLD